MKVIDWYRKGNVVRFILGDTECDDYCGKNWNNNSFGVNAGLVYSAYIKGYIDAAFPIDCAVVSPEDDLWTMMNSPYCKDDFKKRKAPFIAVDKFNPSSVKDYSYHSVLGRETVKKFYFEDSSELLRSKLESCGAFRWPIVTLTYNKKNRRLYDEEGNEVEL